GLILADTAVVQVAADADRELSCGAAVRLQAQALMLYEQELQRGTIHCGRVLALRARVDGWLAPFRGRLTGHPRLPAGLKYRRAALIRGRAPFCTPCHPGPGTHTAAGRAPPGGSASGSFLVLLC